MTTTAGVDVLVPIGSDITVITTDNEGHLVVDKSDHPLICTCVSTAEDKAKRAMLKQKLEVICDLAMHRCVWEPKGVRKNPWGGDCVDTGKGAFESFMPSSVPHVTTRTISSVLCELASDPGNEPNEELVEAILNVVNLGYNNYGEQPSIINFRKAFTNWLIKQAGAATQSGRKFYPKFPEYDSVPKTYFLES